MRLQGLSNHFGFQGSLQKKNGGTRSSELAASLASSKVRPHLANYAATVQVPVTTTIVLDESPPRHDFTSGERSAIPSGSPSPEPRAPRGVPPANRRSEESSIRNVYAMPVRNMEQICRDSVAYAFYKKDADAHSMACRKRESSMEISQRDRQKAAAWREAMQQKQNEIAMKAKEAKKIEEEERLKEEQEKERLKNRQCEVAWTRILTRFEGRRGSENKDSKLDLRIQAMRTARREERHAEKIQQKHDERRDAFYRLSSPERRIIEVSFKRYDSDGSDSLDPTELREVLAELGLSGATADEKQAVVFICESAANRRTRLEGRDPGCNMHELAADVMPAIRKRFTKNRRTVLEERLEVLKNKDGKYPHDRVLKIVVALWGLDTYTEEDGDPTLMHSVRHVIQEFVDQAIDTKALAEQMTSLVEKYQLNLALRQRDIQSLHRLDEELFKPFRHEIVSLQSLFRRVDSDESGYLEGKELMTLFKDLGLSPTSAEEARKIAQDIKKAGQVDFSGFLRLVQETRNSVELREDKTLHFALERVMNACRMIQHKDIAILLEEVNCLPQTEHEHTIVNRVMRMADPEGQGKFSEKEARRIVLRVQEHFRTLRFKQDTESARAMGFSDSEIADIRLAFSELDTDYSGALDRNEVWQIIKRMEALPGEEADFSIAFAHVDSDHSGELEFLEFIRLVKMLRDSDGIFESETAGVTTLKALGRVDLMRILACFQVPVEVSSKYDQVNLIKQASELLDIGFQTQIEKALPGVKKFKDLLEAAKNRSHPQESK